MEPNTILDPWMLHHEGEHTKSTCHPLAWKLTPKLKKIARNWREKTFGDWHFLQFTIPLQLLQEYVSLTSFGCIHAREKLARNWGKLVEMDIEIKEHTAIAKIHCWGSFNPASQLSQLLPISPRKCEGETCKTLTGVGDWDWAYSHC